MPCSLNKKASCIPKLNFQKYLAPDFFNQLYLQQQYEYIHTQFKLDLLNFLFSSMSAFL